MPNTPALDDCLARIPDDALRQELQAAIAAQQPQFGLSFAHHPPAPLLVDDAAHPHGTPVHAELLPLRSVARDAAGTPAHTIINGENLHALELLTHTHAGKIDLIYVDPPYNTGQQNWKYDDNRREQWLSFMDQRLRLAHKLLSPAGIMVVAIGDAEHHRLRLLLDQRMGAENFLANIVWQGSLTNDSSYTGGGLDYMLVYARNRGKLDAQNRWWREPKDGLEPIAKAGMDAWKQSGGNQVEATRLLRAWWRTLPANHPSKMGGRATTNYRNVDDTTRPGHVFAKGPLNSPMKGGRYDVLHPVTGQPVKQPRTGWRHSPERMEKELAAGMIHFREDHTKVPYGKRFIEDSDTESVAPSFVMPRRSSGHHLERILGDKRFPFPKDHRVLARWFKMMMPADGIALDFFGGSGSTVEAIMALNTEDGGTRQAILITNNELSKADDTRLRKAGHQPGSPEYEAMGVFHHVTLPRIETVITGVRPDGSTYPAALPGAADFFTLAYNTQGRGSVVNGG